MIENIYKQQAMEQAEDLQQELKVKRARKKSNVRAPVQNKNSASPHASTEAAPPTIENSLGVRISGWWRWKTVVVPPNMYVVHTRRGYKKPLHVGMGISFRYKSHKDSFLVIPSAMQTIIINANTICKELQGVLIQAYVQWIIDDIETAYRRLDFSDAEDPMRVVNIQLREQAEAAIKDKVATMSIKEVLSDKQPIIKELTKRLKEVAEGSGYDQGLGIRIVTVQIKEAIVSSTELWENLQRPFRTGQNTTARLAEIENEATVNTRELEERQIQETRELETNAKIDQLRSQKQAEEFDRKQSEDVRRHELEQKAQRQHIEADDATAHLQREINKRAKEQQLEIEHNFKALQQQQQFEYEKKRVDIELEKYKLKELELQAERDFALLEIEKEWALKNKRAKAGSALKTEIIEEKLHRQRKQYELDNEQSAKEISFLEQRQKIANILSKELIQVKAMESLPEIAHSLPQPEHLHSVTIGSDSSNSNSLPGVIAALLGILKNYGIVPASDQEKEC